MTHCITTTVLIGLSGVGKSHHVMALKDLFIVDSASTGNDIFLGYNGEQNILIEDFDGWIECSLLRRIITTPGLQLRTSRGSIWADWGNVYITSRYRPRHWYKPGTNTSILQSSITYVYEVVRDGNVYSITQPRDNLWSWANHLQTPYEKKRA